MMHSIAKRVLVALCAAMLVGFFLASNAHALIHKAVGETSTAIGNCAQGCSLAMRIKKGEAVVKNDVMSNVPWTWLDTWGTGTFTVECKCGNSGWHTIQTYEVVDYDLPITTQIENKESPISVWLPANFPESNPCLRVWTYPHPDDYCSPWVWSNATLWWPKTSPGNYSEADLSNGLGTRMVNVQAMLNSQHYGYGEREVTMAAQMTVTGLGGNPGTWKPTDLLEPVLQTVTQGQQQHFAFSTTVTSTVSETESGERTFSASESENNALPAQMTAEVHCGVYDVDPEGGGPAGTYVMDALEEKVGYEVEESRTLTDQCSLAVDVPANRQLTVFLGPEGEGRNGDYDYYEDNDVNGAAESKDEGAYDAAKVTGVYLDYTISELLP